MTQRNSNYRQGDIAESLGTVLLQGAALVAPVPRTEDVGLDVVATLLRKKSAYSVAATNSFYVQLKSSSTRRIDFKGAGVDWVLSLELPLFVGSIDVSASQIELFACHRLTQARIEQPRPDKIELHLDRHSETASSELRSLNIGPPVHSWTVAEMSDPCFVERTYAILAPHLETARRNILLGRSGRYEQLKWETGSPPYAGGVMITGGPGSPTATANLAMPYLSSCLLSLNGEGHYDAFDKLYDVVCMLHELGAEWDPIVEGIVEMRNRRMGQ